MRRTEKLLALNHRGVHVLRVTDYQFRVNEILDIYPTNKKYHVLETGERGEYQDIYDLVKRVINKQGGGES